MRISASSSTTPVVRVARLIDAVASPPPTASDALILPRSTTSKDAPFGSTANVWMPLFGPLPKPSWFGNGAMVAEGRMAEGQRRPGARLWLWTVPVAVASVALVLEANPSLTPAQVAKAEERANQVAVENRPVEVSFEEAGSAAGLRKRSDRDGTLRIISIEDLDRSACGGTHVRATGEIGAILIRKTERIRKGIRVEFVCGGRAIIRARGDYSLLSRLAAEFPASAEELPRLLARQREEVKQTSAVLRELEGRVDLCRARELYAGLRTIWRSDPPPVGMATVLSGGMEFGLGRVRGRRCNRVRGRGS